MGGQTLVAYFLVIVVPFVSSIARADEKSGWAMSVGLGPSLIRDRDGNQSFEGDGIGYNWGPEYRFSQRWALGVDFFSLGRGRDTVNSVETTIDVGGFEFRGRVIFPLTENVDMYGRLGFAGYFADVTPGSQNLGEDAVAFGLGLDFHRDDHWSIRIDGRYFDGPRNESGALLTAGFNYRF